MRDPWAGAFGDAEADDSCFPANRRADPLALGDCCIEVFENALNRFAATGLRIAVIVANELDPIGRPRLFLGGDQFLKLAGHCSSPRIQSAQYRYVCMTQIFLFEECDCSLHNCVNHSCRYWTQ